MEFPGRYAIALASACLFAVTFTSLSLAVFQGLFQNLLSCLNHGLDLFLFLSFFLFSSLISVLVPPFSPVQLGRYACQFLISPLPAPSFFIRF